MAEIKIRGDISGSTTIKAPDSGSDEVIELSSALASKLDAADQTIVQVVSVFKNDTFSTTSNTLVDVTGLSVSITPTSATNKVLVMATINGLTNDTANYVAAYVIVRDSTQIAISSGYSFSNQTGGWQAINANQGAASAMTYLDSPATTSATTYKIQLKSNNSPGAAHINSMIDPSWGAASSLTLMEIKA